MPEDVAAAVEIAPPAEGAEGTATEKGAKSAPAQGGATPFTPEEMEEFRAKAAKLGYELDAGKVTIRERAAFREERRKAKSAIEEMSRAERAALESERASTAKERAEHAEKLKRVEAIDRAIEIGDYQELARLAGKKDWDDLQKDVIAKLADPNYKELQELKRKESEREAKEHQQAEKAEQQAKERETAAQEAARREGQHRYKQYLAQTLQQSKHPLVSSLADDPTFVEAIFRIQEEHWDGESTVTPEQAIKLAIKGASLSLEDELRQLHARLTKGLHIEEAPAAPPAPAKGKSKTDTTPSRKTEAAPSGKFNNDRDWLKHAARRLEEAALRDREEERNK